ncbi:hypothetical protein J6590_010895 [Homalodisca vitripennis]|nr:hypothetical protein J6590_010895 [Homalodisca vitripennis]
MRMKTASGHGHCLLSLSPKAREVRSILFVNPTGRRRPRQGQGCVHPGLSPWGFTAPDLTAPNLTAPDLTAPDLTAPDLTEPNLTAPNLTAPDLTEPNLTAPNLTAPDLTEPNLTAPNLTAPKIEPFDKGMKPHLYHNLSYLTEH